MRVLMFASEATPYAKTGGLADVMGSLPLALRQNGIDVRIALPRYASIDPARFPTRTLGTLRVPMDGMTRPVTVLEVLDAPVPTYLFDAPQYFNRPGFYNYEDDLIRFGLLNRALLELPLLLDWRPNIIHCHDWHAGLAPVYHRLQHDANPQAAPIKTIFTIHNLAYQGTGTYSFLQRLHLPPALFDVRYLEFYNQINLLKGGLIFSDALTTVSPTYAREIQTLQYGAGLDGVLRERKSVLSGVLNGIDYGEWNPSTDLHLPAKFSARDLSGKAKCKQVLLRRAGLPGDDGAPLIGIVSRLSAQKGFDLIAQALPQLAEMGCRMVILGAGDQAHTQLFEGLSRDFPNHLSCRLNRFDEEFAHAIYGGSDMFLMPSHYEPCGLGQLIALAYGTVPIVRATGGLADTIAEFDPATQHGNGFEFEPLRPQALNAAVKRAIECYRSPHWPQLVQNAMACDFSWDVSATQYAELYASLLS